MASRHRLEARGRVESVGRSRRARGGCIPATKRGVARRTRPSFAPRRPRGRAGRVATARRWLYTSYARSRPVRHAPAPPGARGRVEANAAEIHRAATTTSTRCSLRRARPCRTRGSRDSSSASLPRRNDWRSTRCCDARSNASSPKRPAIASPSRTWSSGSAASHKKNAELNVGAYAGVRGDTRRLGASNDRIARARQTQGPRRRCGGAQRGQVTLVKPSPSPRPPSSTRSETSPRLREKARRRGGATRCCPCCGARPGGEILRRDARAEHARRREPNRRPRRARGRRGAFPDTRRRRRVYGGDDDHAVRRFRRKRQSPPPRSAYALCPDLDLLGTFDRRGRRGRGARGRLRLGAVKPMLRPSPPASPTRRRRSIARTRARRLFWRSTSTTACARESTCSGNRAVSRAMTTTTTRLPFPCASSAATARTARRRSRTWFARSWVRERRGLRRRPGD